MNIQLRLVLSRITLEEAFWQKVIIAGPDDCWLWTGGIHKSAGGYGRLYWEGRRLSAHVWSFILANGEVPEGLEVCHSCDNPPCVNPGHLWAGTHGENIRDCFTKDRANRAHGEACVLAKLNETQVRLIRAAEGSYAHIGRLYGTTPENVSLIRNRITWKHVQ